MATYHVDKGFRFAEETETRRKGQVVELSGDELIFALERKCLTRVEGEPEEKPKRKRRTKEEMKAAEGE